MPQHKPNPRNFYGIFLFLFGLGLYMFVVAAGGDALEAAGTPTLLSMLYYGLFGIIWVFPARSLFRWMAKGTRQHDQENH